MKNNDYPDPVDEVNKVINKRKTSKSDVEMVGKSEQLQKTYDNLVFRKKFQENPLMVKHEYKVFGVETVNLNNFLALRMWPRSIYVTDKLLRLVAGSKLEVLKRYIAKKRVMPMNILWLILIIFGVVIAVIVILILLPKMGVM